MPKKTTGMFSDSVCKKLGYYVYRLVDPRNGNTFYVGKGKNNRVFAHVNQAMSEYSDINYDPSSEDKDDLKFRTIKEIEEAGLEVINIIQKYGMTEHDALVAESTLIDVYGVDRNLTNKIKGWNSSEPMNSKTIQKTFDTHEYRDKRSDPPYVIIKVNEYWLGKCGGDRYECTHSAWAMDINNARKCKYALSVTNGIVKEVYEIHEWHRCPTRPERIEFTGEVAQKADRDRFINKRIPAKYRKKGQASPFLYSFK